ncbi:MAG: SLATT domain-containing protein [Magnetococcales bacterium]|nr:SLATT domain-containing protein [Magnetococcales bacterium]
MKWTHTGKDFDQLEEIYQLLQQRCLKSHQWYMVQKIWPSRISKGVRFFAWLLGSVGGIIPLLVPSLVPLLIIWFPEYKEGFNHLEQLGYVFLAISGSLVILDRYFGFSSRWIRYHEAMLKLNRSLIEFQCAWNKMMALHSPIPSENSPIDPKIVDAFLEECEKCLIGIDDIIHADTKEWIRDFKNDLKAMGRSEPSNATGNDDQKNKPINNT